MDIPSREAPLWIRGEFISTKLHEFVNALDLKFDIDWEILEAHAQAFQDESSAYLEIWLLVSAMVDDAEIESTELEFLHELATLALVSVNALGSDWGKTLCDASSRERSIQNRSLRDIGGLSIAWDEDVLRGSQPFFEGDYVQFGTWLKSTGKPKYCNVSVSAFVHTSNNRHDANLTVINYLEHPFPVPDCDHSQNEESLSRRAGTRLSFD